MLYFIVFNEEVNKTDLYIACLKLDLNVEWVVPYLQNVYRVKKYSDCCMQVC